VPYRVCLEGTLESRKALKEVGELCASFEVGVEYESDMFCGKQLDIAGGVHIYETGLPCPSVVDWFMYLRNGVALPVRSDWFMY
jgi:hypothetical protein